MNTLLPESEMPIAGCLQQSAAAVSPLGDNGWEFELRGEVPLRVAARREPEWLRFCAPLSLPAAPRPTPEILHRMLACNAELAPAAKFTLATDASVPCLAAELRLGEEEAGLGDLAARIAAVCAGFGRAVQVFAGGCQLATAPAEAGLSRPGDEAPGELSAELAALCKEAGWPLAQRAVNYIVFELDVPGSFYQAVARPRGPSGLQLGVDLASAPDVSGVRQQALDVLLLHASHCVRTARATVRTASRVTAYGWEVLLDRVANSRELEYVLGALSVACRLSAREVSAFQQDDCLSRSYLKLRGWCS